MGSRGDLPIWYAERTTKSALVISAKPRERIIWRCGSCALGRWETIPAWGIGQGSRHRAEIPHIIWTGGVLDCFRGCDGAPCRGWIPAFAGMTEVGDFGRGTLLGSMVQGLPTGVPSEESRACRGECSAAVEPGTGYRPRIGVRGRLFAGMTVGGGLLFEEDDGRMVLSSIVRRPVSHGARSLAGAVAWAGGVG